MENDDNFLKSLKKVRKNFDWYDKLVKNSSYEKTKRLEDLPFITEEILDRNYYTKKFKYSKKTLTYQTSGTTTGDRKTVTYTLEDHKNYLEQRKKVIQSFITNNKYKKACADLGTGHAASSAKDIFESLNLSCLDIDFTKPIEEHINLINKNSPDIIFTMPMILENMIHSNKLRVSFKKIILLGDVASKQWIKNVAKYFNIKTSDILDLYGTIEVGAIAYYDNSIRKYIFHDHIIPEMIDTKVLGFEGKWRRNERICAITSLTRTAFPAIRYVTYDLISGYKEEIKNGKEIKTFDKILGRLGKETKHGEKISLYDISEAIAKFLPKTQFKIERDTFNFTIKISSKNYTKEKGEKILEYIKNKNPDIKEMTDKKLISDITLKNVSSKNFGKVDPKKKYTIN